MSNDKTNTPEPNMEMSELLNKISDFIQAAVASALEQFKSSPNQNIIVDMPLNGNYAFFKGRKPMGIIYPGEEIIPITNWRQLTIYLLQRCIEDPDCKAYLMSQRNLISGRSREMISSDPSHMDTPIEICPELYFECKFDTEALLKVLINKLLIPAGYNIENIRVRLAL